MEATQNTQNEACSGLSDWTVRLDIDALMSIWSMRPQPGTPCGTAWEDGARWGWDQANKQRNA
jgi:hypothetical protein